MAAYVGVADADIRFDEACSSLYCAYWVDTSSSSRLYDVSGTRGQAVVAFEPRSGGWSVSGATCRTWAAQVRRGGSNSGVEAATPASRTAPRRSRSELAMHTGGQTVPWRFPSTFATAARQRRPGHRMWGDLEFQSLRGPARRFNPPRLVAGSPLTSRQGSRLAPCGLAGTRSTSRRKRRALR